MRDAQASAAERPHTYPTSAAAFIEGFWEDLIRLDPLLATAVGDDRYDHLLPDPSERGRAATLATHQAALQTIATLRESDVDANTTIALDIAESIANDTVESIALRIDRLHLVDHLLGPSTLAGTVADLARVQTAEDAERYTDRIRAIPQLLRDVEVEIEAASAAGIVPAAPVADRVIDQLRRLLDTAPEDTPFMTPARAATARIQDQVARLVRDEAFPAFSRYLESVIRHRPKARPTLGLIDLPSGSEMYGAALRRWTSRDLDPEEVHRIGRDELARILSQRKVIGTRLGATTDRAAAMVADQIIRRRVPDRPALLSLIEGYVARGWEGTQPLFTTLPASNCEVKLLEPFREPDFPGAFYNGPTKDRQGTFYVNAAFYLDPDGFMLHRLATTSFHEASPGHHIQTAIELIHPERPALRRFAGWVQGGVFTEGWGLYVERLADEIGLFQDDVERLGRIDNEALRAARLVVDTGLHAYGWSRDVAIAELEAAGLPSTEASLEVDRYAVDPAQALSYKVGELAIRRLRGELSDGSSTGLAQFHDRILEIGAVPISTMERELRRRYDADQLTRIQVDS